MKTEPKTAAQRQREYSNRQREMGRRQRSFWLTDREYNDLMKRLKEIRKLSALNGDCGPVRA